MAERWQQWMPFHIDRFRGSPEVQAMHPAARCGFLYLLASAWQTDDCTVSADAIDLATASGLGDELWAMYGARILRKFTLTEEGRYRNEVLLEEWSEAKKIFEKRSANALRTNSVRTPHAQRNARRTKTGRKASDERHTVTGTGTSTGTETTETTLASTADAVPAERGRLMGTLPLIDGKEHEVFEVDVQTWQALYLAVDVRQELRNMKGWLIGNPKNRKTPDGVGKFIQNWLSKSQNQARSTRGAGSGYRNQSKTAGNLDAARNVIALFEQEEHDRGALGEV